MTSLSRWRLDLLIFSLSVVSLSGQIAKAQCTSLTSPDTTQQGDRIYFQAGTGVDPSLITGAIGQWSSGCGSSSLGTDFPNLLAGSNSNYATYTVVMGGDSPDAECGNLSGRTITLYARATDGLTHFDCGSQTLNLAHEMGHVLGLNDDPNTAGCQYHIMALINQNNGYSRTVLGDECTMVDSKWITSSETDGSGDGGGGVIICI